ncbi:peptidoglycan DD-metalloendopeptidase family protein [Alkaliphilus oremlandii]|uniref:Peptidase M23B n=1 Tax=Alkaliphilus oremlandii (strain OhILAs) TaxID=350688 RepID=A8MKJ1_ALKOO|nr:M23 family metallopeptidase [Alkaliphilus oremlandii]ABW20323.1 peptidase M23B [Alkaliphilus oremlandii OhILAs]
MENNIINKLSKIYDKIVLEMKAISSKVNKIDQTSLKGQVKKAQNKSSYKKLHNKNIDFKAYINEFKNNKNFRYKAVGAALSLSLVSGIYFQVNSSVEAYTITVDNNVIAIVREEEDFIQALEQVKSEAAEDFGQDVVLNKEPIFVQSEVKKAQITELDEIIKNIKSQIDIQLKAAAIVVNGETVAIVKDSKTAEGILADVKAPFLEKGETEYDAIEFAEKVEIVEVGAELSDIITVEEALQKIAIGTDEEKIHEVMKGENPWTIAQKYGLKMSDIEKANPGLNPQKIQIGQKLSLIVPKPLVSVRTKEYVELVEAIPFETEYEKTPSLYEGDKKITVQGENGQREVKAYLVKENGVELNMEVLEEKIISQPKTRVIAQGTKERPATMATGVFTNPTRGRLTSPFGMRWGRRHTGIDIASSKGTTVTAADAGRVSFAGRQGSYGNLVIIDHENGYQTYYAHNSKIVINKGERVYKGQKIAEMGNTGNSTGVHLHFEVRKNGTPVNPQSFVRY